MEERRKELERIISNSNEDTSLFNSLIEDVLFLEIRLSELRKLPFISVNPNNHNQQKTTPAAKQYKEMLQQYTNCLKILGKASGQDFDDEESPLRKWAKDVNPK